VGKITLALLSGGDSSEREVSLNSGDQVYDALDKDKYEIVRYDPKTDLARIVQEAPRLDAALIILHGPNGEDGTVQGLLDLLNIPYQGSGLLGSAVAMNKYTSKLLYEKADIPTPPYMITTCDDPVRADIVKNRLGFPVVVKPVEAGSSVGMTIVRSEEPDCLEDAFEKAFQHGREVLIEAYINGVELTCGVMGNDFLEAFPLIEIIPNKNHDFFDYEAKYVPGITREICPARIDATLTAQVQSLAKEAHQALFCKGYSRTDMILKDSSVYVLETNTIPGMTATSLLPQAAKAAGYSFSQLLDRLIELGINAYKVKHA
jgi:D-alanine-D-alanine ligase